MNHCDESFEFNEGCYWKIIKWEEVHVNLGNLVGFWEVKCVANGEESILRNYTCTSLLEERNDYFSWRKWWDINDFFLCHL